MYGFGSFSYASVVTLFSYIYDNKRSVFEIKVLFSALSGRKHFTTVRPVTFPCASMYYNVFFL